MEVDIMSDCFLMKRGDKANSYVTDGLIYSMIDLNFTDYNSLTYSSLGYANTLGLPIGVAERTLEVVNKCGTGDNFIFSYGNSPTSGSTFALTQTEFVGYYNTLVYANMDNIVGTTRHIVVTSYDKEISIYVNGILVVSEELEYSCSPNNTIVALNSFRENTPIKTSDCTLYELRFYNKILTSSQIMSNFKKFSEKYNFENGE